MYATMPSQPMRTKPSGLTVASRITMLSLPPLLLLGESLRAEGRAQTMLWVGAGVLSVALVLLGRQARERPIGHEVTMLYLIGLAWLWASRGVANEWFSHAAQFFLLVIPLVLFALQTLADSGALASRRANLLADRLANRRDWPTELADCRTLPEVKALREALAIDAAPALNLLRHPRLEVRLAALSALEFRADWKAGQAEIVLLFARQTKEPLLRAAAIMALANIDDRMLVEMLAEYLRDPSRPVRKAAADALLWDCDQRWHWIRQAVHQALADPAFVADGALVSDGPPLSPEVVADLEAWVAEKGPISVRAAQTLGAHHARILSSSVDARWIQPLKERLANPQTPPTLRIELAQVLRGSGALDRELQKQLLDPANPAPLRLVAAEELLVGGPNPQALAVLRDIAHMPNREMALSTADVVQRRLGVDLGLALGQPLPPLHSRQAADVMRRLMKWAEKPEARTGLPAEQVPIDPKLLRPSGKKPGSDSGTFRLPSGLG
jgi:hypothetical protein